MGLLAEGGYCSSWMNVRSLVFLGVLGLCSCGSCDKQSPPAPVVVAAEPPIPPPPNVLAELTLGTPDDTWKAVQSLIGGPAMLAPPTFGGLLFAQADATLGDKIDTKLPVFGLAVGDPDGVRLVWCAHAKQGAFASLRSALADADNAKFKAAGSEQSIDVLEPLGTAKRVIGLAHGDYVLFATSRADIAAFGPYAYRTLPTKPIPKQAIVATLSHDALSGPLRTAITKQSKSLHDRLTSFDDELRKDHGGRDPDFGDPRPLIDVLDRWTAAIGDAAGDMDHAELDADADADGVHATLTLSPPKTDGPARQLVASMHPGDVSPLLDAPRDMLVQAMFRSDADERAANATGVATTMHAVTEKQLPEKDAKRLADALQSLAQARGDYFMLSLAIRGAARGLAVTTHVGDDAKATSAVGTLVDQSTHPPLYALLQSALSIKTNKTTSKDLGALGTGKLLTFDRDAKDFLGPTWQVAYASKGGLMGIAISPDAPTYLGAVVAPEHKLSSDPKASAAIGKLGRDCTFAAVLVPSALNASPGSDPVVLGWGKRGDDAFLSADAATNAARQLLVQIATGGGL